MFRRSRRRIVLLIMSVLVSLWATTLGVIYASSYFELREQNRQMLKTHARMYTLPRPVEGIVPHPGGNPPFNGGFDPESPRFQLTPFYTVAIADGGELLEIKNPSPSVYSNESLQKLAKQAMEGKRESATVGNLAYYLADKGGYTLVVFMDTTLVNEGAMTLLRYTLVFGALALVLFFFLSVYLARKIVAPLEESYEKQKQFISDAGHELKTPVSVVNANAELLARQLGENPWLANIQYENQRMGTLVTQLLELSRTESVSIKKEALDFSRLVDGEALPFESLAFEKGLVLVSQVAQGIRVEGNGEKLRQLVSILLDNAIRHSTEQGEVRLLLTKERGLAKLLVLNRGEPIPAEQRARIFERFYRMDPARSGEDGHYGLGLAIAKAIVTAHKGRLELDCFDGWVQFKAEFPSF